MEVPALCAAADSLGLCVFGRSVTNINTDLIVRALNSALGTSFESEWYVNLGIETLQLEKEFSAAVGFTEIDDALPDFFYTDALPPLNKTARHRSVEVNRFRDA